MVCSQANVVADPCWILEYVLVDLLQDVLDALPVVLNVNKVRLVNVAAAVGNGFEKCPVNLELLDDGLQMNGIKYQS